VFEADWVGITLGEHADRRDGAADARRPAVAIRAEVAGGGDPLDQLSVFESMVGVNERVDAGSNVGSTAFPIR